MRPAGSTLDLANSFRRNADAVLYHGDCLDFLAGVPAKTVRLIVTSPPYNIGKKYEQRVKLEDYLEGQAAVIKGVRPRAR